MSEREAFLTRWSRRKREAAQSRAEPAPEQPKPAPAAEENSPEPQPAAPTQARAELEASLPPIDAIESGTDIRGFLKHGVPADLARAALRRAWSTDPAIRDFVGLSENSWDFNAPDGVPGFGPFSPDLAQQAISQVLGTDRPVSEREEPAGDAASVRTEREVVRASEEQKTKAASATDGLTSETQPPGEDAAAQNQTADSGPAPEAGRRSGRALPK
jgi:hypothetical protein